MHRLPDLLGRLQGALDEGEAGTEHKWWMTVNTQPGQGTPKDWESMGGGYKDGKLQTGKLPTREEFGGGWDYNYDEVLHGGKGRSGAPREDRRQQDLGAELGRGRGRR